MVSRSAGAALRRQPAAFGEFDGGTDDALRPLLDLLRDAERLAAVGTLIVDCGTGAELLEGARRLGQAE